MKKISDLLIKMTELFPAFILSLIMLPAWSFLITGCTEESALSDVALDDPSLVRPEIIFEKYNYENRPYDNLTVRIFDKNKNPLELKNGSVLVEGEKMKLLRADNLPFYSGIEAISSIQPGKTYNLEIRVNQEKHYPASIKIPDNSLLSLNVPSQHNRNENMNISWTRVDTSADIRLKIITYYIFDKIEHKGLIETILPKGAVKTGKYEIPASYFLMQENLYKVNIKLISVVSGTIYEGFLSGSKTEARFEVSQNCNIY